MKYKIDLDEGRTQDTQLLFWNKWLEDMCLAIGSCVLEIQTQTHRNSSKNVFKSCMGRLLYSCAHGDGLVI